MVAFRVASTQASERILHPKERILHRPERILHSLERIVGKPAPQPPSPLSQKSRFISDRADTPRLKRESARFGEQIARHIFHHKKCSEMNSIRLFQLLTLLAVALFQAPQLVAQNDRGPALSNVPALINNLADTKPLKHLVEGTYSPEYFLTYSAAADHVQGMARLANGNYVFSHSTFPWEQGFVAFSRPNNDAVFKQYGWESYTQSHPSGLQACGNILATINQDPAVSVHFFDATNPDNPVELTHLRITNYGCFDCDLDTGIDAVGLVYNEAEQKHYLTLSKGSEAGREDGPVWLFKSNGLPLTDPNCEFTYDNDWFFRTFTAAAGFNLLYDESGNMYAAAMYRTDPGGEERIRLTRFYIETIPNRYYTITDSNGNDFTYTAQGDTVKTIFVTDIALSGSGYYNNSVPGFRWGGGIAVNNPNSIDVFASSRLLASPNGNHCVIKIWKGLGVLDDCRKYSDVSWLTSHNAFAAPSYGYDVINNQSLDLEGQLTGGARAFTLQVWEKANLNAPSGGPAYNAVRDAMSEGVAYLLNDPGRQPAQGGFIAGKNWPFDFAVNKYYARLSLWLDNICQYLLDNPSEVVTLFLEGDAGYNAHLNALQVLSDEKLDLFMNESDYANIYHRTLGEMRSSGRRLAVFRAGGTHNFNVDGRSFQFRDRFEKTVENVTDVLPISLNNCDKRAESANLDTPERLVVFNHLGQPFHELIVRRWLDHCSGVGIPNFLVVNNVTDGSLGVQPKDAVNEFNRRMEERIKGGNVRYRIMVAGSSWNISQENDDDGAKVLTSDNPAEWDFILNSDKSYFIRLKGTNRYLTAPANIFNNCQMKTDTDTDRARWYAEPLPGGALRLFSQHSYAGTRKAMREVDGGDAIKLSDNIDFVDVGAQKFELRPVPFLSATCKPATVVLDENGSAILLPEAVKDQISYSGICEAALFATVDKDVLGCADLGTQQVTLSVTNGADLNTTCTTTVTVVDNTLPSIDCPPTKVISADANCEKQLGAWSPISATDNCSANPVVTQSPAANTLLSGHNDSEMVTLSVNDGHGNERSCQFQVILKDQTAPNVQCKNHTAYLDASGMVSISASDVYLSGTDNCGTVNLISVSPSSFTCSNIGLNTVILETNDGHNNPKSCSATVTVVDNTAPTVNCKLHTAYLNASGTVTIAPTDVLLNAADNCGTINPTAVVPNIFNCSNLGANAVVLSINDGNGNSNTCNTTVTIVDNIAPSVVCKTFDAFLNAAGTVSITPNNVFQSGADNCGVVNLVSVSPSNFTCAQLGSNPVTLTANDGHGNGASCNTYVIVKDAIAPTVLCNNVTLYLNSAGQASLTVAQVNNGSFDNCSITALGLSQSTFTCANTGSNTVTLSGTDQSGNKANCNATVTVLDAMVPVSKCKDLTANLPANGTITISASSIDNGSFDNCSHTLTLTPNAFTCANVGLNTVTLRATDASGNSSTCTAKVTVRDLIAPTALCKNATIFVNDLGNATLNISQINNGSSDACGISTMSLSKTQFNCSDIPGSSQTVTLTLKDVHNNVSTCNAQVTTKDNMAPTAVCENTTVNLGPNGTVTVYPQNLASDSYDNCSVWSYSPTAKLYTTANMGNNNLTITVKDWSGNAATCVSVVTVIPYAGNSDFQQPDRGLGGILLFPNPTSGTATLTFQLPSEQKFVVRVFDLAGRMVYQHEDRGLFGENTLPIRLNGIASGVYILDFQSEDLKAQQRIVVQE